MYIVCMILILIIIVETMILVVGKDKTMKWLETWLEETTGACTEDMGLGLYYAEAADFVQNLKS